MERMSSRPKVSFSDHSYSRSIIGHGKTNALKIALAASANFPAGYTTYLSESTSRHYLASACHLGTMTQAMLMCCGNFSLMHLGEQQSGMSMRCSEPTVFL